MTAGRASVCRSGGTRRRKRWSDPSSISSPLTVTATLRALTAGADTLSAALAEVGLAGTWADATQVRQLRSRPANQERNGNRMTGSPRSEQEWTGYAIQAGQTGCTRPGVQGADSNEEVSARREEFPGWPV